MATKADRDVVKRIRDAVREGGYDFWFSYNDKLANGRKIKFMRNGVMHTSRMYNKWTKQINKALTDRNIVVKSAQFEECYKPGYGPYQAFVVRI